MRLPPSRYVHRIYPKHASYRPPPSAHRPDLLRRARSIRFALFWPMPNNIMSPSVEVVNVGGLLCKVYNKREAVAKDLPVSVLLAAHGRGEDQDSLKRLVEGVIATCDEAASAGQPQTALIVVTMDQRNHGTRMVDEVRNEAFKKNDMHAIDMHAIHRGTARDISLLIDYLPMYLFPQDERSIACYMVTGVSLGGHSTWLALRDDPRLQIGIPIIGCPDYKALIQARIEGLKVSNADGKAPVVPASLWRRVAEADPIACDYKGQDPKNNPFIGKKILVLTGADDTLVPAKYTKPFVDALNVGPNGALEMVDQAGAGHEVTDEMIRRTGQWIWKYALRASA